MIYGSWDMKCNRPNFFVILGHLHPFTSQQLEKWKYQQNEKNSWRYHFTQVYQKCIMIICYTVPEIWLMKDVIVIFILGNAFPFYPPNIPKKWKFPKNEKQAWKYHYFTQVLQKSWSYMLYCSWDMAHVECNCHFSF